MGGGATLRLVGLLNHTRTFDRKHFLRPRIRYGRSHSYWNRATHYLDWGRKAGWCKYRIRKKLGLPDEVRETASIRMADYQQRASAHYNRKARPRSFKNGTLVFRKVFENTAETGAGKFQANWEDPYIVSKTSESGAYHLQKLDGTPLLRPWNVSNLKQYYQWKCRPSILSI